MNIKIEVVYFTKYFSVYTIIQKNMYYFTE